MQISVAANSQALNANPAPLELRGREAQKVLSSVESVVPEEELKSNRAAVNRDRVTLSPEAAQLSRLATDDTAPPAKPGSEFVGLESSQGAPSRKQQAAEEQQELEITRDLAQRDREVRNHERIHASIGGQYASAPSFTYERGPDGRLYAVEGEVRIDTSSVPNDPRATLEKAEIIQRAALSVAEPSAADRAAAADARAMAAEARAEILQAEQEEQAAAVESQASEDESEEEDDSPTAGERLQELRDERQARSEGAAAALNEFNDRMKDINKELAEINKKLVDAGVFQKLFPEGSLLDQQV